MRYKDLQPLLPASWEDVTLEQYLRIYDAVVSVNEDMDADEYQAQMIDNTFSIISKLIDVPLSELYKIDVTDIAKVCLHVAFLNDEIKPLSKPLGNQKKDVDTSYSNMITYKQLTAEPDKISMNLPTIVESFLIDVKPDDVLKMNMVDVTTVFFFAQKSLTKYHKTIRQSLLWKIWRLQIKQLFQKILSKVTMKK